MIKKVLKKAGLSDKEIEIYLMGLKIGPSFASHLSRKTGISRQNTYDVLKKLEEKGLSSSSGKAYNTLFTMENPKRLDEFIVRNQSNLEKIRKDIELALPELESIYRTQDFIPKIKFYDGEESIKKLVLDSLNCQSKEVWAIIPTSDLYKRLGTEFVKRFIKERVKRKIKNKTIRLKSKEDYDEKFFHKHKEQLREMRYAPKGTKFSSSIIMYDNKTVFISSEKEDFGFVIESNEYQEVMKSLFDTFWKVSKKR